MKDGVKDESPFLSFQTMSIIKEINRLGVPSVILTGIIATYSGGTRQTCIDADQVAQLKENSSQKRLKVIDTAKIEASCHLFLACLIGAVSELTVL